MDEDKKAKPLEFMFEAPKLPFAWLASTFIAPMVVLVIPEILTNQNVSFEHRVIVALTILSVMLFVSCIRLMLHIYSRTYEIQVLKLNHNDFMKESEVNQLKIKLEMEHVLAKTETANITHQKLKEEIKLLRHELDGIKTDITSGSDTE